MHLLFFNFEPGIGSGKTDAGAVVPAKSSNAQG
jgi:hypothetical protein